MTIRLLVVTNLYPPQELGGYGRCISDFVHGLSRLGYLTHVICSDAPYLHNSPKLSCGVNGEYIHRVLRLNGSFDNGVNYVTDYQELKLIEAFNRQVICKYLCCTFDAVLIGNIDLIGVSILSYLSSFGIPVLHHIGFIQPPFNVEDMPVSPNYQILSASYAVRESLLTNRFPVNTSSVIYPGARCDLFSTIQKLPYNSLGSAIKLADQGLSLGSISNPLKIGYAGLLMGSKGAHTIVEALIILKKSGIFFQAMFAGSEFQNSYLLQLIKVLDDAGLKGSYQFVGQLERPQLARFWSLQHFGIFSSIYPEAFGIVGAEIMASGIVLLTTGVGGATELIEDGISGLLFPPENSECLAKILMEQSKYPLNLLSLASNARNRALQHFDVSISAKKIDKLIKSSIAL